MVFLTEQTLPVGLQQSSIGCAGFAQQFFSLQSETNKTRSVSHAFRTLMRKKMFFRFLSLLFASNFSLPIKTKLIQRIFALFRFQKFVVSLLFRFVFASFSFSFRFRCEKSENKTFFASKRKNFTSVSLRSENDGSFSLPFRVISLRSENDGNFSLLFRFVFASFHFHRCETSEKSTFFLASKRKKFRFRFASFRFEA
jgi:hypothetical protein